jgi:hypothetical protein
MKMLLEIEIAIFSNTNEIMQFDIVPLSSYIYIQENIVMKHIFSLFKIFVMICGLFFSLAAGRVEAQISTNFDFSLGVDYSAAEQTLDYFDYRTSNVDQVAKLRGNQLVATTSVLLARTSKSPDDFRDQLELARKYPGFESDVYGFFPAKNSIPELRKLIDEVKRRQLDRRIVSTIASFFPAQARVATRFSVYLVVIGNERASAFERHVVWNYDTPAFVNDGEGEPVIVVNLAQIIKRQSSEKNQFIEVLSTTAHECFHAALSIMQKSLPESIRPKSAADYLFDLVQNEGCAYYLSLQTHLGGDTPGRQWFDLTSKAVEKLNSVLLEMHSPNISHARAQQLLYDANLSGSFEANYGATSGLRMAYEIDNHLGRPALTETLLKGGRAFILAYQQTCLIDPSLPLIDKRILNIIDQRP